MVESSTGAPISRPQLRREFFVVARQAALDEHAEVLARLDEEPGQVSGVPATVSSLDLGAVIEALASHWVQCD